MARLNPWGLKARRERLKSSPWPEAWEDVLSETAHASLLTDEQRAIWRDLIQILIAEKKWDGCDGLEITDNVQVTVASQAALMLLGMPHSFFKCVRSIVVFPSEFEMLQEEWQEKPGVALGQAAPGAVLLAWDKALAESRSLATGNNLVIHEFAHHLDFEDGYFNGRPECLDRKQSSQWREVMSRAFAQLSSDDWNNQDSVFDDNAATNATEFFSEASERFFTVPFKLRRFYPEVYELLENYYGLKTVKWFEGRDCET